MKIRAILSGNSILVQPDPVRVLVGEPVYWEFMSVLPNPLIRWEVYFQHGTPFGALLKNLTAGTTFLPIESAGPAERIVVLAHYGLSPSVVAATPGEHKYGVRAQDAKTEQTLADDDPLLIILR